MYIGTWSPWLMLHCKSLSLLLSFFDNFCTFLMMRLHDPGKPGRDSSCLPSCSVSVNYLSSDLVSHSKQERVCKSIRCLPMALHMLASYEEVTISGQLNPAGRMATILQSRHNKIADSLEHSHPMPCKPLRQTTML